jgi:hypothetical protein
MRSSNIPRMLCVKISQIKNSLWSQQPNTKKKKEIQGAQNAVKAIAFKSFSFSIAL